MKKLKNIVLFCLIVALIFTSCQSTSKPSKKGNVEETKKEDTRYLTYLGKGSTEAEADQNAKLGIAAYFNIDENSPSFLIPILGTEILEQNFDGTEYSTLARLDKRFSETIYRNEVNKRIANVNKIYDALKDHKTDVSLYDIWKINDALKQYQELSGYLTVLSSWDESVANLINEVPTLETLETLDANLAKEITIIVTTNGQSDSFIYGDTLVILNDRGFVINARNPRYNVIIDLDIYETNLVRSSDPHYHYEMNLSIMDNKADSVFLSTNYSGNVGGSTLKEAQDNLSKKLKEIIAEDFSELFDYSIF